MAIGRHTKAVAKKATPAAKKLIAAKKATPPTAKKGVPAAKKAPVTAQAAKKIAGAKRFAMLEDEQL